MLIFWILFSIIVPIILFCLGILFDELFDAKSAFVCWGLALIALAVGLYFVSADSEEDIKDPTSIVETDYNYCPYCGEEFD